MTCALSLSSSLLLFWGVGRRHHERSRLGTRWSHLCVHVPCRCLKFALKESGVDIFCWWCAVLLDDRKSIVRWFRRSNKSPVTGELLASVDVVPNFTVRSMIAEFIDSHSLARRKRLEREKVGTFSGTNVFFFRALLDSDIHANVAGGGRASSCRDVISIVVNV